MTTRNQVEATITRAAGDADNEFRFRISSSAQARDGISIPASAWETEHFLKNPVVLLQHGHGAARDMPIGAVTQLAKDDMGLVATIKFDDQDEHAINVMRKLRGGFLNAVSVGFIIHAAIGPDGEPLEVDRYWRLPAGSVAVRAELLEVSVVSVPADPHAVAMRQLRAQSTARHLELMALLAEARRELASTAVPARLREADLPPGLRRLLAQASSERP